MSDKNKFTLFGFKLRKNKEEEKVLPSFIEPTNDDGSTTISGSASGFFGSSIDMDGSAKSEAELITRYREMALQPEIETAIEHIINDSICYDDDGKTISLVLDDLKVTDKIKKAIEEEFQTILKLLNYNNMAQDIFKRYYVDGRLFFNVIVDTENPKQGIQELRYIDPRKIKKVREVKKSKDSVTGVDVILGVEEYYIFSDKVSISNNTVSTFTPIGIKIAPDSIISVVSGLMDSKRVMVLSYLQKAIRSLNQLRMVEDASVINKIVRSPQRRIFYIDVGNLPKQKAEAYVYDIMAKYKNKLNYNVQTGAVESDRKYLSMLEDYWLPRRCLSLDTKIDLLDGRTLTLNDLIEEYNDGKENWVYSISPEGNIVPGKITWAGITRKNAEVLKITLDNDEFFICTPDHKIVLRDGTYIEAKDLKINESLMPLYTRNKQLSVKYSGNYHQIFNILDNKWVFTHRQISKFFAREKLYNEVIHHIDFNRYNNNPNNLIIMDKKEHFLLHSKMGNKNHKYNKNKKEWYNKISISVKKWFSTLDGQKRKEEISYNNINNNNIKNGLKKGRLKIQQLREYDKINLSKEEYYKKWINLTPLLESNEKNKIKKDSFNFNIIENIIKEKFHPKITSIEILKEIQKIYPNFKQLTSYKFFKYYGYNSIIHYITKNYNNEYKIKFSRYNNHKIKNIEYLEERIDTGTLTIDEYEEHHNYHNFALHCGIFVKNSGEKTTSTTEIKTLESADSFDNMSMVEYFEKKLYKSLGVPVTRLDPQQAFSIGRSSEITRDELLFSKFIDKLRNKFSELFDEALRIQLVLKGICTLDEWNEFKEFVHYDFIKDNYFTELKDSEIQQDRLGLLAAIDPYTGKYYSKAWIQKNVLRLNDDEIKEMKKEIELEIEEDIQKQLLLQQKYGNGDEENEEQETPPEEENNQQINPYKPYGSK